MCFDDYAKHLMPFTNRDKAFMPGNGHPVAKAFQIFFQNKTAMRSFKMKIVFKNHNLNCLLVFGAHRNVLRNIGLAI
jgi:hypothetical protein